MKTDLVSIEELGEDTQLTVQQQNTGWTQRAGRTFKELDTQPEEWQPAEINADNFVSGRFGLVQYVPKIPEGYEHVRTRFSSDGIVDSCELCGHFIAVSFVLLHPGRKMFMFVGSDCITHFGLAEYLNQQKKAFVKTQVNKSFDELWMRMIRFYDGHRVKHELWIALNKGRAKFDSTRKMQNFLKKWGETNEDDWRERNWKEMKI